MILGSKITADGDCSHEIKRLLLLGRKIITNLDSIFKSRDREEVRVVTQNNHLVGARLDRTRTSRIRSRSGEF